MAWCDTSKKIHDIIISLDIKENEIVSYKSGTTLIQIQKVNDSEYMVKIDGDAVCVTLDDTTSEITKYKGKTNLSDCVKRAVHSYLFQLFERLKRIEKQLI